MAKRKKKGQAGRRIAARQPSRWPRVDWMRWAKWAVAVLLIVGTVGPGLWGWRKLQDPSVLPLKTVHIEGDFHYLDRERLQREMQEVTRGGFFSVDVNRIRETAEALPWVDAVHVRRIWPDTLKIFVTEQMPMAFWGGDGLINARGEVFRPNRSTFPKEPLPQFNGPDDLSIDVARNYALMGRVLAQRGLAIRTLNVSGRRSWDLALANGLVIKLGNRDLEFRLLRFMRYYPRLTVAEEGELEQVDLRYTNGFAVQRKPLPASESGEGVSQLPRAISPVAESRGLGGIC